MDNLSNSSWVDILSNNAFLRNAHPDTFTNILLEYKYPPTIFFSFLHESTHHWCFNTAYGNLIFGIRAKCLNQLSQLLGTKYLDEDLKWEFFNNDIRYTYLIDVYKPLLEGIALFSEFDSWPSESESLPPNLIHATRVFSRLQPEELKTASFKEMEDGYWKVLHHLRFTRNIGVEKKKNLLLTPLELKKSVYLSGYLFLKNLQIALIFKNSAFEDSSIFLQFIRHFFLNDPGLINAVFTPNHNDHLIASDIFNWFVNRVGQINHLVLSDEYIKEFENGCINQNFFIDKCVGMFLTQESKNSGMDKLSNLLTDVLRKEDTGNRLRFLKRSYFRLFSLLAFIDSNVSRVLIRVALPKDIEIDNEILLLLESGFIKKIDETYYKLVASFPNVNTPVNLFEKGIIEQYNMFEDNRSAFVFIIDKDVVYESFSNNWSEEGKLVFKASLGESDFYMARTIQEGVDFYYRKLPRMSTIKDEIADIYDNQINSHYAYTALAYCPDDFVDEVSKKMFENGFWELLGEDEECVELLVLISMINSSHVLDHSFIKKQVEAAGIDFDSKIKELLLYLERHYLKIVIHNKERTIAIGI